MTAQEKAKCGLWLLKQAILDYLATRPDGARSVEVRKALALKSDVAGTQFTGHWLIHSILVLLVRENKVNKVHRRYFRASQAGANAASGPANWVEQIAGSLADIPEEDYQLFLDCCRAVRNGVSISEAEEPRP
jgi:hypothetical protein